GRACIEHAAELPAEDRAWFERQGNRSVVLMPIFAGTEWWGHIGFDECVVDRVWSDAEIGALKAAAATLGAAIQNLRWREELRRREAVLSAVAFAAERFLAEPTWEEATQDVLDRLGRAAGVSRVYVFRNGRDPEGRVTMTQLFEWVADGVEPQIANPALQDEPWEEALSPWVQILAAGDAIHAHVRLMSEDERRLLEPQAIRSIAVVPLFVGADWWGAMGFDQCDRERDWSASEIDTLKAAAGILGATIDRQGTQRVVQLAEENYRRMVELSPDGIAVHRNGEILMANTMAARLVGADSPADLVGRGVMEFVHPASRPVVAERMRLMMTEGATVPLIEERFVRLDGTTVDVEASAGPLMYQGEPAIQVVVRDVSERLRAEQQLREAESKYRRLIEQIPVLTYVEALDELGSTIYVSPQLESMLGYSPEEWTAEPGIWVRVLHPEDRRRVLAERQRVQRSGERLDIEYRLIRRDGRPLWLRDESVLIEDAAGRPLFRQGVVVDINRRKVAEEHLREAETRYRTLVERLPAVTYVVSDPGVPAEQTIAYVSPQIEELLGCTRQEWLETDTAWRRFVHPEDVDRVVLGWNAVAGRGDPYSAEYRVVHRDGSVRWVRDEAVLMRDEMGRPMFWQGIMIDATERKQAEATLRTALERERDVAQGLRALDEMKNTFLAAVSHELRTPLSAILGFALTLDRDDVDIPPDEAKDLLRRLAVNARKLDRLLSDLLDLDRLSRGIVEPRRRSTDIAALVRQVVEDAEMPEDHRVLVRAEPVTVSVDPSKVERILENLIVNAARYTPAGTTILVTVSPQGGGVLIAVDDEGPGVPEDLREAIFEPFRQGPGRLAHSPGVGVGLTLVARFAELHGGRAWVEPRDGGGSSFRVSLPAPPLETAPG
ncbi:MAG TPA: PAS domain S-box protein, partial [Actinomycetota bacterium]|nr:PAS domain S-box protein [Actinomycetota bacterium]